MQARFELDCTCAVSEMGAKLVANLSSVLKDSGQRLVFLDCVWRGMDILLLPCAHAIVQSSCQIR
eukprot:5668763-Pleurochrysis_carterae.AAC.1